MKIVIDGELFADSEEQNVGVAAYKITDSGDQFDVIGLGSFSYPQLIALKMAIARQLEEIDQSISKTAPHDLLRTLNEKAKIIN